MTRLINRVVVHCSATKPSVFVDASVIDRWHRAKGWLKIGYHYVILRNGKLEKGRQDDEVGAHVAGFNKDSLGVCMVGGLSESTGKPEDNFTDAQYETLRGLLLKLTEIHPDIEDICGHRDLSPDLNKDGVIQKTEWLKSCPCFDVRSWWEGKIHR